MKTRNYRRRPHRYLRKVHKKKSYKGGQARWPAPPNPAPPHAIPPVSCRLQDFRPLILSQFGGTKRRRARGRRTRSRRTRSRRTR